jgi:hypothetical protein
MLRWAHKFRVALNPIYSDEHYDTGLVIDLPIKKIENLLSSWGCELNHPNQFEYPNQVLSGHLYLKNGKQLHIRVKKVDKGLELKGHVEWHGVTHPILHMLYANLDYEKGYQMVKNFLEKSNIKLVFDEREE